MSIATLNKYKKQLKAKLIEENASISFYEKYIAECAANILDYKNQLEDVNTAIQILKMHKKG